MIKPAALLKEVTENRLLPVYLLVGEEYWFHRELSQAVLNQLLSVEEREFNYLSLNAAETNPEELLQNLETPPFFGPARLIMLDGLETAASGIEEAILKGLNNLASGVFLLISAAKLDGRKKLHQELQKHITTVDCNRISTNDLPDWIGRSASGLGLNLTSAQIRLVGQRLGNDLLLVQTELEKLRTFAGTASKIKDSEFDALIPAEAEPNIFSLIDAVAERNPRLGLPRLEELLDSGENETKILATLARQFRNITAALEARKKGLTIKALAGLLGINPYVAEKSFAQSGRFALDELEQILKRLLWADYRIKTGQQEPRLELELAVAQICGV